MTLVMSFVFVRTHFLSFSNNCIFTERKICKYVFTVIIRLGLCNSIAFRSVYRNRYPITLMSVVISIQNLNVTNQRCRCSYNFNYFIFNIAVKYCNFRSAATVCGFHLNDVFTIRHVFKDIATVCRFINCNNIAVLIHQCDLCCTCRGNCTAHRRSSFNNKVSFAGKEYVEHIHTLYRNIFTCSASIRIDDANSVSANLGIGKAVSTVFAGDNCFFYSTVIIEQLHSCAGNYISIIICYCAGDCSTIRNFRITQFMYYKVEQFIALCKVLCIGVLFHQQDCMAWEGTIRHRSYSLWYKYLCKRMAVFKCRSANRCNTCRYIYMPKNKAKVKRCSRNFRQTVRKTQIT